MRRNYRAHHALVKLLLAFGNNRPLPKLCPKGKMPHKCNNLRKRMLEKNNVSKRRIDKARYCIQTKETEHYAVSAFFQGNVTSQPWNLGTV